MKNIILFMVAVALTGCAQTVNSIKEDGHQLDGENFGYVLLGVDSNQNLKSLSIKGSQSIEITHKDLRRDGRYILVKLKSGRYYFSEVSFGRIAQLKINREKKQYWTFDVFPNQINYVGNLEVNTSTLHPFLPFYYQIELLNNSSSALEYVQESFPSIFSSTPIAFTGVGNDEFLQKWSRKD